MNSAKFIRPLSIWNNDGGVSGSECQLIAAHSPLAFPSPIDDLFASWLEPNVSPAKVLWQKIKITVGLVNHGPATALENPVLFEHQSELGISRKWELGDKRRDKRREGRLGKADTMIAAANHPSAWDKLPVANDRSQSGECLAWTLAGSGEMNQFVADIETSCHIFSPTLLGPPSYYDPLTREIECSHSPPLLLQSSMELFWPQEVRVSLGTAPQTRFTAKPVLVFQLLERILHHVAGLLVTVTNVGTNEKRKSTTNSSGAYEVNNLFPGVYVLEVEMPGFEKYHREKVELASNQNERIDVSLVVSGQVTQISVTSEAATPIETETAKLSDVRNLQQLQSLPLAARSVYRFLVLTPGASLAARTEPCRSPEADFARCTSPSMASPCPTSEPAIPSGPP